MRAAGYVGSWVVTLAGLKCVGTYYRGKSDLVYRQKSPSIQAKDLRSPMAEQHVEGVRRQFFRLHDCMTVFIRFL